MRSKSGKPGHYPNLKKSAGEESSRALLPTCETPFTPYMLYPVGTQGVHCVYLVYA